MPAINAVRLCDAGGGAVVVAVALSALIPLRSALSAAGLGGLVFDVQTRARTRARPELPPPARPLSAETRSAAGLRLEPSRSRQRAARLPSAAGCRLATLRCRTAGRRECKQVRSASISSGGCRGRRYLWGR